MFHIKRTCRLRISYVFTAIILVLSTGAYATTPSTDFAVLVGVNKYTFLRNNDLNGPENDVAALANTLISYQGYSPENVITLTGEANTTKARILSTLAQLENRINENDRILIYLSGHGTSKRDFKLGQSFRDLHNGSGAFLPSDARADDLDSMIVGRRDLRAPLKSLEKKASKILFIIDACFSGSAVRSISAVKRQIDFEEELWEFDDLDNTFDETVEPYPYDKVISLSASGEHEVALESEIAGEMRGEFTYALQHVLENSDQYDTNRDGELSYIELYDAVRLDMRARQVPHGPVILPASSDKNASLVYQPMKKVGKSKRERVQRIPFSLNATSIANVELEQALASAGVPVTSSGYYKLDSKRCRLLNKNDETVAYGNSPCDVDSAVALINGVKAQQQWINKALSRQTLLGRTGLTNAYSGGTVVEGERLRMYAIPEQSAYLLVIGVLSNGDAVTLYPASRTEVTKLKKGIKFERDIATVSPPFGLDYLDIYLLDKWPVSMNRFIRADFNLAQPSKGTKAWHESLHLMINEGEINAQRQINQLFSFPKK